VTLTVYLLTLAPTVTLEAASGHFAVAADHFGVGRVPGYPLWTVIAGLFTGILGFLRYHGHPNPALACNLMSACFGALTCGTVAWLVTRTSRDQLRVDPAPAGVAGFSAGCLLGFSPVFWSQSVITETVTFGSFLIVVCVAFWYAALASAGRRLWKAAWLVQGLGLSHGYLPLVMLPVSAFAGGARRAGVGPTVLAALGMAALAVLIHLLFAPSLWTSQHLVPLAGCVMVLTGIWAGARTPWEFLQGLLLLLLPLLLYLYLPVASDRNPPMNTACTRTWPGFLHCISRGQYERVDLYQALYHPLRYAVLLRHWAGALADQFTVPIACLGLVPLARIRGFSAMGRTWLGLLLLAFLLYSAGVLAVVFPSQDVQTHFIARVFFAPALCLWSVFIGYGLAIGLQALGRRRRREWSGATPQRAERAAPL